MVVELDLMEYATDVLAQAAYPTNGYHAVTFNVTAQLDTAEKRWGTASLLLDGDSDYLTLADHADWDIVESNSDDWTIDFLVKHTDHVGVEPYITHYEDDNNRWLIYNHHANGIRFAVVSGGGVVVDTGFGTEIADTNWHHIALCKVGNKYGLYKDGTQIGYVLDDSVDTFAGFLYIGLDAFSTPSYFDGHIDDLRIIHSNIFGAAPANAFGNGEAPDTITVPTAPHQTDTNTKLLLHFDGGDGVQAALDWSRLEPVPEDTIKQQGSYSLKGFAKGTDSLNDTLIRTVSPTIDLSGLDTIRYYIRSSRTGSNIKIGIRDSGGLITEHTANIGSANTWEQQAWDISGVSNANKDVINQIIITIINADADNTLYLDGMYAGPFAKALADTLAFTDAVIKKTSRLFADTLAFTDALSVTKIFYKALVDALVFTDTIIKKTKKSVADTLTLADAVKKKTSRALADALAFTDALATAMLYHKLIEDTLAFTDSIVRKFFMVLSDALSFTTKFAFWGTKGVSSTSWTDASVSSTGWTDV